MDFFNIFRLQLILLCFGAAAYGQIETGKVGKQEPAEKIREKKVKEVKPYNYNPVTTLYLGIGYGVGYRTLKENSGYFGEPLGERANETPRGVVNYNLGVRQKLTGKLFLDVGVSLVTYGESYDFSGTDTMYRYDTKYTHFAVPIRLQYITGNKWKFIGGVGIQPQMFLKYKRETAWENTEGLQNSETSKSKTGYNLFTIAALANAGVQWQIAPNTSLYLLPEARIQLNSTLMKQAEYIHKGVYYGVQFGFAFGI